MAEIRFRTDDLERQELRERKEARTNYILETAGIAKDNPDYNRWYQATLVNVHNAYRFSYNGETEADLERVFEGFISAIKENPIDKYEEATKEFLYERVALQLDKAAGDFAKTATYEEMRGTLNETMISGIKMRKQKETTFPKEFYKENGGTQRLVYEIPLEKQEESAMRNIDMMVAKYKDKGVEFSSEKNKFIVKGNEIGPEKFFTSKRDRLNKFLNKREQNPQTFDASDQELFNVIQSGDFEKNTQLRKQRGMNRDKMNEDLRNALSDEIIFYEISERWNTKESQTPETLLDTMRETSEKFSKSGEIVRKESEKDVLGSIDRIIFSILPEDLATQSTFKNWKSCMHTTGCNHDHVDDSIGTGSIVAYGYDSREPYKMVSRLLIHPYKDNFSGEIAYKVNDRIYGRNNIGFRKAVAKVTEHFNEGKLGVFHFPKGLYNDNGDNGYFSIFPPEKDGVVDLMNFGKDRGNVIFLSDFDLSKVKEIKVPEGVKIKFKNCTFEEGDLSKYESASFEQCSFFKFDFSQAKEVSDGLETKFEKCTFKHCILKGDLSKYEDATFEWCSFKNAVLPENATLKGDASFENTQVPKTVNLQTPYVNFVKKYVDTKGTKFEKARITLKDIEIPDGADLSFMEGLRIKGSFKIGKGVKLPEKVVFEEAIIDQDLSEYQQTKMELCFCTYNENCKLDHTGNTTIKGDAMITHENAFREVFGIPADSKEATIGIPKTVPIVPELLDTYSAVAVLDEKLIEKAKTQKLEDDDVLGIVYAVAKDEKTKKELSAIVPTLDIMTKEEFIQNKHDISVSGTMKETIQNLQGSADKKQLALQITQKNQGRR